MEKEVTLIINWIKDYIKNSGAKGVVIGNSGGKDSATVIGLCAKALGSENVLTVAMPCSSINQDLEDAKLVSETFGVKMLTLDLTPSYNLLVESIEKEIGNLLITSSTINMSPRLRMLSLYAIAQQYGFLVAGTGNACEIFVGYTTKWGDSASDFNPLANFTVNEVLEIGKIIGVPEKIINKAPNDGLGSGTDEDKLGVTYAEIEEYMSTGKTANKLSSEKIEKLHKQSTHKREKVPFYSKN